MRAIVAVSNNWGIGKNNKLLFHIKEDMQRFKELTTGHVCVMGRKTFESFPFKKPLANRTNVVLTNDGNYKSEYDNVIIVHTMDELKELIKMYPPEEVYLIGGGSSYIEPFVKEHVKVLTGESDKVIIPSNPVFANVRSYYEGELK